MTNDLIKQGPGRGRMVVGFTTTCGITDVVSLNLTHGEVYSIQHYLIKFVSDLRQVSGFLQYSGFLEQITVTTTI